MKIKFNKRTAIIGLVSLMVVAIVLKRHHAANSLAAPAVPVVSVITIKESTVPLQIQAVGTLTAKSVDITPELAGHVNSVLVADGAEVKKGTPILQLDDAIYRSKMTSAKAQLAYSDNNYKRMVLLGKQGAIAKQAIDQAESDLKQRQADAIESDVMVQKMQLRAPFDGVVGKIKVNPGDYVTVGQSIVTLTDVEHLRIEYAIPEMYLSQLKLGQEVNLSTSTYSDKTFVGHVAFISPVINPTNRSLQLYADVANDAHLLAPGMFVTLTQTLGQQAHAVMVPARSAVSVLDGQQMFKIVDSKAVPVTVKLGLRQQENVQVTDGLAVGDVVVTDGQMKLRAGAVVKIQS